MKIEPKEFIRIWQTSETLDEVEKATGMSRSNINNRAYEYREKGVPLRKLQGRKPKPFYDWVALSEYARSLVSCGG